VTPYAAGCGACGADLERLRQQRRRFPPALARPLSWPGVASGLRENLLLTALMVAVALFAPLFGLLFAALVAFDRNRKGERTMRNLAIASGTLALITFFFPFWPLGQLGPVSS
jgi:hypothetical protein